MPSTLQYPLERQRDLQRRWARLLQRTAAPDKDQSPTSMLTETRRAQQQKLDECSRRKPFNALGES
jgi:hypothetical protein